LCGGKADRAGADLIVQSVLDSVLRVASAAGPAVCLRPEVRGTVGAATNLERDEVILLVG
jgi:hypothetical protein